MARKPAAKAPAKPKAKAPAKAKPKSAAKPPAVKAEATLSPQEVRFVAEYMIDRNGARAARSAGYAVGAAKVTAHRLLKRTNIKQAIDDRGKAILHDLSIEANDIHRIWWELGTADVNEVVSIESVNCRHCYGKGYEYQWRTQAEFQRQLNKEVWNITTGKNEAERIANFGKMLKLAPKHPMMPSAEGGFGFDEYRTPNPKCPYCGGVGSQRMNLKDTTNVTGAALSLIEGIETTQHGVKVKLADRNAAIANLAKSIGMFDGAKDGEVSALFGAAAKIMQGAEPLPVQEGRLPKNARLQKQETVIEDIDFEEDELDENGEVLP